MKISRKLRKALLITSLALLVGLGVILKLPQLTFSYAQSSVLPPAVAASFDPSQTIQPIVFPQDFNMVNIKTVYGAKGDGLTDDTAAIQLALSNGRSPGVDYNGKPKAIYFPAGTY